MLKRMTVASVFIFVALFGLWVYEGNHRALPAMVSLFSAAIALPILVNVAKDNL